MTTLQKGIKYLAMALAIFLTVGIIGGILSAIGLFGGMFEESSVMKDIKTYTLSSNVTELDIRINAANFTIKQSDSFLIESNLKNLSVSEKNGILTIEEHKKFGSTYTGAALTLYVPKDICFDKADITTGAGRLTIDYLTADVLKLEVGACEVSIDVLTVNRKADIDGGAGEFTVYDSTLYNLDLDMGLGQLNLTSEILGNSELNLGIGESNLTLKGNKDNYHVVAEKGIGGITVDGESISDYNNIGNGQNHIEISGGIGTINLRYIR